MVTMEEDGEMTKPPIVEQFDRDEVYVEPAPDVGAEPVYDWTNVSGSGCGSRRSFVPQYGTSFAASGKTVLT